MLYCHVISQRCQFGRCSSIPLSTLCYPDDFDLYCISTMLDLLFFSSTLLDYWLCRVFCLGVFFGMLFYMDETYPPLYSPHSSLLSEPLLVFLGNQAHTYSSSASLHDYHHFPFPFFLLLFFALSELRSVVP